MPPTKLLTTVSRIVSNAVEQQNHGDTIKVTAKKKPKAIHVVMWLHIFSLLLNILLGWIDLIPGS